MLCTGVTVVRKEAGCWVLAEVGCHVTVKGGIKDLGYKMDMIEHIYR